MMGNRRKDSSGRSIDVYARLKIEGKGRGK